jgi:membrane associated rhomboid family serine protease
MDKRFQPLLLPNPFHFTQWEVPLSAKQSQLMLIPLEDAESTHRTPYCTYSLILLNVLIYGYCVNQNFESTVLSYAFYSTQPTVLSAITAMFMHADIFHLLGNMWFLWIVGDNVEDQLGHLQYLLLYFALGIAASYASAYSGATHLPAVGASGAISGIMGAYMFLLPRALIKFGCFIWLLPPIMLFSFHLPAVVAMGFWFFKQTQNHLLTVSHVLNSNIGYAAHAAGFLGGLLLMVLLTLVGAVEPEWLRKRRNV